jgi:hypothetical protein
VYSFHIAAGEKLHADKLSGAIVRSVAKLAGINLQKFGSFSYWFDNLGFTIEGKLAVVLIITLLLGFSNKFSSVNYTLARQQSSFSGAFAGEKEDFCKESLSLPIFYFVIVLLYFIFVCIVLSKIHKITSFIVVMFTCLLLVLLEWVLLRTPSCVILLAQKQ